MKTIYEVTNASRDYVIGRQTVHALQGVSITVSAGELVLVQGKSGSGKTTLLNLMGGLDTADGGNILFEGRDISTFNRKERTNWHRKDIGFIFQAFALLPDLTAFENVDLAARLAGRSAAGAAVRSKELLQMMGLGGRMDHRIGEMSGGEQQRVAVARSLAGSPRVILADEPTGELDHESGARILGIIRSLVEEDGITVCMSSHDPAVRGYADRTYVLEDGLVAQELKNHVESGTVGDHTTA